MPGARETAGDRIFAKLVHGGQPVLRRERDDPIAARVEIGIGGNQQRADTLAQECGKGGVQLRVVAGPRYDDPLADLPRGLFQIVQLTCGGREVRIEDRTICVARCAISA
jgi:hypothetical protein